jgi:hypothetical protein
MPTVFSAIGLAVGLAGIDKLVGQRGYERMFGDLDWTPGEMRAAAAAEVAGGLMMVSPETRALGGVLVAAASAAVLASELRRRDAKLAGPRALVLLAGIAAAVGD